MFKVSEIADKLGVKENTVYTWIRDKKLNVTRFGGSQRPRIRITQEQLDEFMQA